MILVAAPATDKDSVGKPADLRSDADDSAGCRGMTCFSNEVDDTQKKEVYISKWSSLAQ